MLIQESLSLPGGPQPASGKAQTVIRPSDHKALRGQPPGVAWLPILGSLMRGPEWDAQTPGNKRMQGLEV